MAHPKHQDVRRRYGFRCGYCGVHEIDAGGELTVDHFNPSSHCRDESDENLIYACFRCNSYKSDFVPTPEEMAAGRRLLHPVLDSLIEHIREDADTGNLVPITVTGAFHIGTLQLNRPALIEHRRRRRLLLVAQEIEKLLETRHTELNELLPRRTLDIDLLRQLLKRKRTDPAD